jgi:hypothetical protein
VFANREEDAYHNEVSRPHGHGMDWAQAHDVKLKELLRGEHEVPGVWE